VSSSAGSDPRPAQGLPTHPPLRTSRQRPTCRQHRRGPRVARGAAADCRPRARRHRRSCSTASPTPLPVLRWPDAHHQGLCTGMRAAPPADARRDPDRHVMNESILASDCTDHPCRAAAGRNWHRHRWSEMRADLLRRSPAPAPTANPGEIAAPRQANSRDFVPGRFSDVGEARGSAIMPPPRKLHRSSSRI